MAATALTIKIGNSNSLSSPTQKAALPQLPAALPQGQSVISVDESVIILDNCCKSLVSFAHNVPGISKVIQEFETLAIQLAEASLVSRKPELTSYMHYPLQEAVSIPQSTLSGSPPVDSSPVLQHPYERPQTEYATLEHWLYLLQKTAWLLREKCIRYHQYPINMLNLFGRRRKLCEMGFQIRNAWVYLMLALGQSLSEKQARVALNTTNNISKLAVATGQGDFEGLHIDDAEQLFMQGEKHFLGFGVPRCFETALKRYQAAANLGLSAAYTMLGTFNEFGIGMTVNMAAAIKHYETAATKGNSDAIFQLGKLSEHGKGLEQNYKNAHEYYKKASDLRHVESLARLGTLVEHGNGCEQNQKHAVEIYRTAANQGSARAQTSLGSCFYSGNGTRRDRFEAVIWFKKAADQGHAPAQYNLGVCYEQGHGFAKDLAMAKIMYKQAADHKHPAATCSLGYMYLAEGQFLDAINTLHIAISLGNNEALFHLGTLYESGCSDSDGLVLSQDLDMALRYYEQASKKHIIQANIRIASILVCGPDRLRNMRRAIECLEIAASPNADSPKGDADAQNMLGELFETGEGSEASTGPHMENAVAYYKRAVIQGHSRAMFNLACLYEQGNGVAHDISRAVKLHCEAKRQGNANSITRLAELQHLEITA